MCHADQNVLIAIFAIASSIVRFVCYVCAKTPREMGIRTNLNIALIILFSLFFCSISRMSKYVARFFFHFICYLKLARSCFRNRSISFCFDNFTVYFMELNSVKFTHTHKNVFNLPAWDFFLSPLSHWQLVNSFNIYGIFPIHQFEKKIILNRRGN